MQQKSRIIPNILNFKIVPINVSTAIYSSDEISALAREWCVNERVIKTADEMGFTKWHCSDCSYSSKYKTNVTQHVAVKHLQLDDTAKCHYCGMECPTKNALRSHIWRLHKTTNLIENP